MLSEAQKLTEKKRLRELPKLEQPIVVRLKFIKKGSLQYISHLDLQRTFNRVIVRACIPVWYTKGFNPHAKLVFSTPLSVGTQSVCEYLDLRIDREMSCEEIKNRLNRELTEDLHITEAYLPTTDFSKIAWAEYDIEIHTEDADSYLACSIEKMLTQSPLLMIKKTKSGEKEIDIISLINSVNCKYDEISDILKVRCILSASSTEYLNPEMLITALKERMNILVKSPIQEWYSILRTDLLNQNLTRFR